MPVFERTVVVLSVSTLLLLLLLCSQLLKTSDGDLLVDYSKNIINDEVMKMLLELVLQLLLFTTSSSIVFTTIQLTDLTN